MRSKLLMGTMAGAVLIGVSLTNSASAASFSQLITQEVGNQGGGPDNPIDVTFKVSNFDMGTVYPDFGSDTELSGVGTLNDNDVAGANGAMTNSNGDTEDTWGIFQVTDVDVNGVPVWSLDSVDGTSTSGTEVTGMFWGSADSWLRHDESADTQTIQGSGFKINLFEDSAFNYDPDLGSGGRTAVDEFSSVTDGTKLLEAAGEPGHLNASASEQGGTSATFESVVDDISNATGSGNAFVSVLENSGVLANILDTDTFAPKAGAGFNPADLRLQFDTLPTNAADWLVRSDDPISGAATPTPSAALVGLGLFGMLGMSRKRRRREQEGAEA